MRIKLIAGVLLCAAAMWAQDPNQAPAQDPNQAPAQDPNQAVAQDPNQSPVDPNQPPAQDPPSRVARLNLVQGQVSFQPATVNEWTAATLNYPVTIGDHVYADDASRAELHIGTTAVRLGPKSGLSVLNLDDRLAQIRVDQGALIIRVKYLEGDDAYEIDTAQGAVTILRPGEYRIDTDPDRNATMVTVRSGDAAVSTNGGNFPVHPHQTAFFAADGQPQFQTENPNDPFDLFAMDQDRGEDRMPAPRYVSREMPGWQDLERNGTWNQDPTYGPVWQPQAVASGWAPYRDGHWAWVEPWGWTWIDDAPWGFAPFHYGRWVMTPAGWAWVPGPMAPRPVYAPAMVAFVGGRGFSMAVGVGGGVGAVAWFPLGPREVFVPAYRVSPVYVNRVNVTTVNITNVTVVNRVYVNQTVGVTAVDQRAFVSAQPVRRAMVTVPPGAIERAQVFHNAAVVPQRSSVLAHAGPPMNVAHPSTQVMQRPVFAQHTPPPAAVSFAARQQALRANPGRPVDPQTVNRLRSAAPMQAPSVRALPPSVTPPVTPRSTPQTPSAPFNRPQYPATAPAASQPAVQSPAVNTPRPPTQPEVQPRTPNQPALQPQSQPAAARPAARTDEKAAKKDARKKNQEDKKEEK